jgi:hypothetical protein
VFWSLDMSAVNSRNVRVEMSEETLIRLLAGGQVCAADFRCLDASSKQSLWRLCLECCANTLTTGTRHRSTNTAFVASAVVA